MCCQASLDWFVINTPSWMTRTNLLQGYLPGIRLKLTTLPSRPWFNYRQVNLVKPQTAAKPAKNMEQTSTHSSQVCDVGQVLPGFYTQMRL